MTERDRLHTVLVRYYDAATAVAFLICSRATTTISIPPLASLSRARAWVIYMDPSSVAAAAEIGKKERKKERKGI